MSANSTFKPALMLMSGRAIAFAITFFVPPVLARVFSQSEFGTYKQFVLITYTLFSFGQFGLAECLFYFLPANPGRAGRYAFNSLVMLGVMGLVFSGGLLLNTERVAHWLNNDPLAAYLPLASVYLIFLLMGTVLEITMITRKNFRLATATYVVSDILRAALLVLPALIFRNLEWTLVGAVAFCVLRVFGIFAYFRTEFGPGLRFDFAVLKEQLAYAIPFFCSVVIYIIQQNYHQYSVSWHFDAATFAIYSVGCLQVPLVDFMATPAANVMMVQMGEDLREGRPEKLLGVWHDTTRKLAFVFFPLVGLLVVNAHHLITLLFTSAYAASVPIFMVWSLSILQAAFQTDGVLRTFAQNRYLIVINVIRLLLIVTLMSWFLTTFYLIGAVVLTLIGIAIAKTLAIIRIRKLLRTTLLGVLPWGSLGWVLVVSMLSAVPALILNAKFDGLPPLLILPVSGVVYMAAYCVLIMALGLLSEEEKEALRSFYVRYRRIA